MNEIYDIYEKKYVYKYHYGDDINKLPMVSINDHAGLAYVRHAHSIEEAIEWYGTYHPNFEKDWKKHIKFLDNGIMQYARIENNNGNPLTKFQEERWKDGKIDAYWVVYEFYIVETRTVNSDEIKID